jgi:hypothetical protein
VNAESFGMNAVAVFAGAFLILTLVTLVIPGLPPGEFVLEVLGFPQVSGSFLGVSVSTILNGLVNGFLWGFVVEAVYAVSRRGTGRKPLLPLHLKIPNTFSASVNHSDDPCVIFIKSKFVMRTLQEFIRIVVVSPFFNLIAMFIAEIYVRDRVFL